MTTPDPIIADLAAETHDLDELLAQVNDWDAPSPAAGWAIRDQVSHLAFFDDAAVLALTDPGRFHTEAAALTALGPDFPDHVAARYRDMAGPELADWFRRARTDLLARFATADMRARVPWFGPDMSVRSSVTARLMETWAHGMDVADALGVPRTPTPRLRHIAHLGVRTRGFSFRLRGRPAPETEVAVELTGPDGDTWTWGPPEAPDRVIGTALDFCLVVTQRAYVADTDLVATGPTAAEWLSIAQAFAGAPGPGRVPTNRRTA